jgi:hypothetical protein
MRAYLTLRIYYRVVIKDMDVNEHDLILKICWYFFYHSNS